MKKNIKILIKKNIKIYKITKKIYECIKFSIESVIVFGPIKTMKFYIRHLNSILNHSFINKRISKEIKFLANGENIKPGSSIKKGYLYQGLIFPETKYSSHRSNTFSRIKKIKKYARIKDARILDIGCSNGSLSLGLGILGAQKVLGIDYDNQSIRVANAFKDKYKIKNVEFKTQKISPDKLNLPESDILIWLSNWMWLVKEYGINKSLNMLYDIPKKTRSEIMIFESAADDGMAAIKGKNQQDIQKFLEKNTPYNNIKNIGSFNDKWRKKNEKRNVFICSESNFIYQSTQASVERVSRKIVRKRYQEKDKQILEHELKCLNILEKYEYFPKILKQEEFYYEMDYRGKPIENITNYKETIENIIKILKKHNIIHRDITPQNILKIDNKITLIDFEWATINNYHPKIAPKTLGKGFYDYNKYCDYDALIKQINLEKL